MKATIIERIEDKLYQNRYLVDTGRPHITVRPHRSPSPNLLALTQICPAKCYEVNEIGQVAIVPDGCLECGTCYRPAFRAMKEMPTVSARQWALALAAGTLPRRPTAPSYWAARLALSYSLG